MNFRPYVTSNDFFAAANRGALAWVAFLQVAEQNRRGDWGRLPEPRVGATVAEDILTHGPALWEHVRSVFAATYVNTFDTEELFVAEHRFWALLCLRDRAAESTFQPWIFQRQPFWLKLPLCPAAAEARLTLWRASMDNPLDERSTFDLDDLLARTEIEHTKAVAEEAAFLARYKEDMATMRRSAPAA